MTMRSAIAIYVCTVETFLSGTNQRHDSLQLGHCDRPALIGDAETTHRPLSLRSHFMSHATYTTASPPPAPNAIWHRLHKCKSRRSLGEWTGRFAEVDEDEDLPPLGSGSGVSHVRDFSFCEKKRTYPRFCTRTRALYFVRKEMPDALFARVFVRSRDP